jgi:hypothetical protein
MSSFVRVGAFAIALVAGAPQLSGQQTQGDAHANYSIGTTTHSSS